MLQVRNEVGRLRRVLLHRPGREIDHMVPAMMEELLFDDILYGDSARAEHELFRRVLTHLGVECLEVQDLLVESLGRESCRNWLIPALEENMTRPFRDQMREATAEELAEMLIGGIRSGPEQMRFDDAEIFEVPPIPNLCFQRDPQVVIGNGVVFCSMSAPARWREVLLSRTIFRFHPELSETPVLVDPIQPESDRPLLLGLRRPSFEGGDLLVLSPEVVAVGLSERTNRAGVRQVAHALSEVENGPRWLIVVALPQRRAYMHLDTLITMADRDVCLAYPPVMVDGGSEQAPVYEIDLASDDMHPVEQRDFLSTLGKRGFELEMIACGGGDPLSQRREQWTDGANALALAPGIITLYDRNIETTEELGRHGFRIVEAEKLLEGGEQVDLDRPERVCILLPSHELSRARGGPHCLSQPFFRDD